MTGRPYGRRRDRPSAGALGRAGQSAPETHLFDRFHRANTTESNEKNYVKDQIPIAIRRSNVVKTEPQFDGQPTPVYRCYFMFDGHVEEGCNLDVLTLDAAIATGRKILADQPDVDQYDGLEIWLDQALLYRFTE